MSMLVDSHCHLDLIDPTLERVDTLLAQAAAVGVGHFLCVSVTLENAPTVRDLAARYPQVSASVGVHPNHLEVFDYWKNTLGRKIFFHPCGDWSDRFDLVMEENPTAEAIARLIYEFTKSQGFPLTRVRLWETETSYATYDGER